MQSAWRKPDRCGNIESAVTIKISDGSQLRRVTNAVALVWLQAAVSVAEEH
jgi:hypothetical protein